MEGQAVGTLRPGGMATAFGALPLPLPLPLIDGRDPFDAIGRVGGRGTVGVAVPMMLGRVGVTR